VLNIDPENYKLSKLYLSGQGALFKYRDIAMSNPAKTYFLAPNFDITPPPTGLLFLGSIITDPRNPTRSLTKEDRVPIPSPDTSIHQGLKLNWFVSRAQVREGKIGIWTTFLAAILGIGVDVEISRSLETAEIYRCKRLETQYFQPEDAYIYEALQVPRVKSYLEKSWFCKPVYMITGLKFARGATAESGEKRSNGGKVNVGVDGTPVGILLGGGPKLEGKVGNNKRIGWEGSSDFVFAYQLIRIKSRKNGTFTEKDYNKGALYNADDEYDIDRAKEKNSGEELHREWEVVDVQAAGDENLVVTSVADEDGIDCFIVVD
jgi:hypothetical protein